MSQHEGVHTPPSVSPDDPDHGFKNTGPEAVVLSIEWDNNPRPGPIPLLCIPRRIIDTFSTKPRKWLMYVATVICGVDGELRYFNSNGAISEREMENRVNGGDHFVFRLSGEPNFVDWHLRDRGRSRSSVTSLSRDIPLELEDYYGGCPFTKFDILYCQACHLIPFHKGTEYLRNILRLCGDPDDEITVDSNQNVIVLAPNLHVPFDKKHLGFLKTPNRFLKTNEIPGLEKEDAESYHVTLQYFADQRPIPYHGSHSQLTRGSGLSCSVASKDYDPHDYRPKDVLLDLVYVSGLLALYCHGEGMAVLEDYSNEHYRGKTDILEEDLETERREAKKRCRQKEEKSDKPDWFDFILSMHYLARNTTPRQVEAEIAQHRREVEENRAERLDGWGKELRARRTRGSPEYLENPEPSVPAHGDDDEIAVSVEDALSRSAPNYIDPSVSSAFSDIVGSDEADSKTNI